MKKDLKSYIAHDQEYNSEINNLKNTSLILKKYDEISQFQLLGFELALSITRSMPKTHIDIGSGSGWLLRKMSPYFETTIGVEPSAAAVQLCQEVNNSLPNMKLINLDMSDALTLLNPANPVFLTTATVLSHIEDFYVSSVLVQVNDLPNGSIFYFDERYGKNHHSKMWHIRSRDWWLNNLPDWQVIFMNLDLDGYPSGIYGRRVGKTNVKPVRRMSLGEKFMWQFGPIQYFFSRIIRKISQK